MHRTTAVPPHHRRTRTGDLHRSLYAAMRCSRCNHGAPSQPPRRLVARYVVTIKLYRLRRALRHPVLWAGDRALRRGTL